MLDLSARVFYKAHFEIEAKYNDVSTFDEIIYGLYNWLHYKYGHPIAAWNWQQFRRFGEFQIDDGRVEATSTSFWNYDLLNWACKIEEYQIQDSDNDEGQMAEAPRIWTTEVGFEQVSQEKAVLSYVLYYRDKAGFIGRIAPLPNPSVPGFVKSLLYNKKIRCLIGNDTLRVRSSILKCGSGKAFAERIANDERVVPYILVLPDVVDGEIEYKVEAESIAKNVMGNALVFSVESMGVVDEINYYLDRDLNCRQGQIMIYWSAGSLSRYRFISARQVENLGESEIIEVLRRVFSTDIKYYDTHEMFRMDDCNEMYRRKRISDMRAKMVATEQLSEENASTTRAT